MDIVIDIAISIVLGAGSGYAAVRFLGKKWVDHMFAKRLNEHQAVLDRMTNELTEKLKVEYENLQPRRLDAIRVISILLLELKDNLKYENISKYASSTEEENWVHNYVQLIVKNTNALVIEIRNNNILFSDETAQILNDLKDSLMKFEDAYIIYHSSINEENFNNPDMSLSVFWYNNKSILLNIISSGNLDKLISRFRDVNKANIL